jgi:hypothetical protein
MSCVQWDDMLAICMEFTEYSNEEVVIERERETIIKNVEEPKDLTPTKPKTTKKKKREKVLA